MMNALEKDALEKYWARQKKKTKTIKKPDAVKDALDKYWAEQENKKKPSTKKEGPLTLKVPFTDLKYNLADIPYVGKPLETGATSFMGVLAKTNAGIAKGLFGGAINAEKGTIGVPIIQNILPQAKIDIGHTLSDDLKRVGVPENIADNPWIGLPGEIAGSTMPIGAVSRGVSAISRGAKGLMTGSKLAQAGVNVGSKASLAQKAGGLAGRIGHAATVGGIWGTTEDPENYRDLRKQVNQDYSNYVSQVKRNSIPLDIQSFILKAYKNSNDALLSYQNGDSAAIAQIQKDYTDYVNKVKQSSAPMELSEFVKKSYKNGDQLLKTYQSKDKTMMNNIGRGAIYGAGMQIFAEGIGAVANAVKLADKWKAYRSLRNSLADWAYGEGNYNTLDEAKKDIGQMINNDIKKAGGLKNLTKKQAQKMQDFVKTQGQREPINVTNTAENMPQESADMAVDLDTLELNNNAFQSAPIAENGTPIVNQTPKARDVFKRRLSQGRNQVPTETKSINEVLSERVNQMAPEDIQKQVYANPMTGLYNERAYQETLPLAPEGSNHVSIDLNSLKAVNDNISHEAGDDLLKAFADSLKGTGLDMVFHPHGDEFKVIVEPGKNANDIMGKLTNDFGNVIIELRNSNGTIEKWTGGSFEYGIGENPGMAESNLKVAKDASHATNKRGSFGTLRPVPGTSEAAAAGAVNRAAVGVGSPAGEHSERRANISTNIPGRESLGESRSEINQPAQPEKEGPVDLSKPWEITEVDPDDLSFREKEQNRTENLKDIPTKDFSPTITIIEPDNSRTILDGHNRTKVAQERGEKLNAIGITRNEYKKLQEAGYDDIEISFAALARMEEKSNGEISGFSEELDRQFRGAGVARRGLEALELLESEKERTTPTDNADFSKLETAAKETGFTDLDEAILAIQAKKNGLDWYKKQSAEPSKAVHSYAKLMRTLDKIPTDKLDKFKFDLQFFAKDNNLETFKKPDEIKAMQERYEKKLKKEREKSKQKVNRIKYQDTFRRLLDQKESKESKAEAVRKLRELYKKREQRQKEVRKEKLENKRKLVEFKKAKAKLEGKERSKINYLRILGSFKQTTVNEVKRELGYDKPLRELSRDELRNVVTKMKERLQYKFSRGYKIPAEVKEKLKIKSEPKRSLGKSFYEANRNINQKKSFRKELFKSVAKIQTGIRKIFVPVSTRLENISPKLKYAMRKMEFDLGQNTKKNHIAIAGYLKATRKMSNADWTDLDIALKNGDIEMINSINQKYHFENEYQKVKTAFDDIHKRMVDVGMDVGYEKNYWPRIIKDVSGFLDYIKGQEYWSILETAIKNKEIEIGRVLTPEEKAGLINTMIRGFRNGQLTLSKPGAAKERTIDIVSPMLNQFYYDSATAAVKYVESMNEAIAVRKFFGKGIKSDQFVNISDSIGKFTADLLAEGKIKAQQEIELREMLEARFNPKGTHGLLGVYKNLSYIDVMGSPLNAITQLGDMAWAIYRGGLLRTVKNALMASVGKSRITKEDVGVEAQKIAQEFSDASKTSKAVNTVFEMTGLNLIDKLGKETLLNTSFDKFKSMAKKENPEFISKLNTIFGNEANQVLNDLKAGIISDNVKYLVFNDLLDFHPVSLSEMPEKYLSGGNGRILYALKSYTLKQFDIFRREAFRMMNQGHWLKGIRNLLSLAAVIMVCNGTADVMKDFLLNRKIDLSDTVVDNLAKLAGFSQYLFTDVKHSGLGTSLFNQVTPPANLLDDLGRDFTNVFKESDESAAEKIKNLKALKHVPLVGKFYYYWFGGGSSKKSDNSVIKVPKIMKKD